MLEKLKDKYVFFDIDGTLSELKLEVIMEVCKHYNIPIEKAVFVDDRIDVLRKSEEIVIVAYHPSSFVE